MRSVNKYESFKVSRSGRILKKVDRFQPSKCKNLKKKKSFSCYSNHAEEHCRKRNLESKRLESCQLPQGKLINDFHEVLNVNYEKFQTKIRHIIVDVASVLSKMEVTITHNWICFAPPPIDAFEILDGAKKLFMFLDCKLSEIEERSNLKHEEDAVKNLQLRSEIVIYIVKKVLHRCEDIRYLRDDYCVEEVKKHIYLIERFGLKMPFNCSVTKPKKKTSFSDFVVAIPQESASIFIEHTKQLKGILIKKGKENTNGAYSELPNHKVRGITYGIPSSSSNSEYEGTPHDYYTIDKNLVNDEKYLVEKEEFEEKIDTNHISFSCEINDCSITWTCPSSKNIECREDTAEEVSENKDLTIQNNDFFPLEKKDRNEKITGMLASDVIQTNMPGDIADVGNSDVSVITTIPQKKRGRKKNNTDFSSGNSCNKRQRKASRKDKVDSPSRVIHLEITKPIPIESSMSDYNSIGDTTIRKTPEEEFISKSTVEESSVIDTNISCDNAKTKNTSNSEDHLKNFKNYKKSKVCIPKKNVNKYSYKEKKDFLENMIHENSTHSEEVVNSDFICSTFIKQHNRSLINNNNTVTMRLMVDKEKLSESNEDTILGEDIANPKYLIQSDSAAALIVDKDDLNVPGCENITQVTTLNLNEYKDNKIKENHSLTVMTECIASLLDNPVTDHDILKQSIAAILTGDVYSGKYFLRDKPQNPNTARSYPGQERNSTDFKAKSQNNSSWIEKTENFNVSKEAEPKMKTPKVKYPYGEENAVLMDSEPGHQAEIENDLRGLHTDNILKNSCIQQDKSLLLKNYNAFQRNSNCTYGTIPIVCQQSLKLKQHLMKKSCSDKYNARKLLSKNSKGSSKDERVLNIQPKNVFSHTKKNTSSEIGHSITLVHVLEKNLISDNCNNIRNSDNSSKDFSKIHQATCAVVENKSSVGPLLEKINVIQADFTLNKKSDYETGPSNIRKQINNFSGECYNTNQAKIETLIDPHILLKNSIQDKKINGNSVEAVSLLNPVDDINRDLNINTSSALNHLNMFSEDFNKTSQDISLVEEKKKFDMEHHFYHKELFLKKNANAGTDLINKSLNICKQNQVNNKKNNMVLPTKSSSTDDIKSDEGGNHSQSGFITHTEGFSDKSCLLTEPSHQQPGSFTNNYPEQTLSINFPTDHVGCSKLIHNLSTFKNYNRSGTEIKSIKSDNLDSCHLFNFKNEIGNNNKNQEYLECINQNSISLMETITHSDQLMNTEQFMQNSLDVNFSQNGFKDKVEAISLGNIKKRRRFKNTGAFSSALDTTDLDW